VFLHVVDTSLRREPSVMPGCIGVADYANSMPGAVLQRAGGRRFARNTAYAELHRHAARAGLQIAGRAVSRSRSKVFHYDSKVSVLLSRHLKSSRGISAWVENAFHENVFRDAQLIMDRLTLPN
jgi:hypothetical protein